MRTARRAILPSLVLGTALGCVEDIASPGACPEFCPDAEIVVRDTLLTGAVERDSSYFGYVTGDLGAIMPVTSAGAGVASHGVLEFLRFPTDIQFDTAGARAALISTDSFELSLALIDRNESTFGLEIIVYALPVGNDSSTTFTEVDGTVSGGTIIGVGAVPDTIVRDSLDISDSVTVRFPASGLPTYTADSNRVALALSVRAGGAATFAEFGTAENGLGARLTRFATVDSAGSAVVRRDVRALTFDTFLSESGTPPAADELIAGQTPSARSLLRFNIPPDIIDSSTVVGATLFLVPVGPTLGAPQDTFELQATALAADFGAKSPIVLVFSSAAADSLSVPAAQIPVGSMDTIAIDVTPILRNWQSTDRPHSMIIRANPEGGTLGTVLFGSSAHPTAAPALRLIYVNPFRFEGR